MLRHQTHPVGNSRTASSTGRPLYEWVGEKVAEWGADHMGDSYSYIGAVVGATYPEMGKVLRKVMPKSYILVPGYGAQEEKEQIWYTSLTRMGLGAIVNSSRGIIAAYKQEKYAKFGAEHFSGSIQSSRDRYGGRHQYSFGESKVRRRTCQKRAGKKQS